MFKVKNKDTRTTPNSVSIVNFEHVIASWENDWGQFFTYGKMTCQQTVVNNKYFDSLTQIFMCMPVYLNN